MFRFNITLTIVLLTLTTVVAQDPEPPAAPPKLTKAGDASDSDQGARLAEFLSGVKFIGKFTMDGSDASKTEEYTISKCEKLPEGDLYRMTARIKYGDTDSEIPLDLPIRWSGSTPVITLDNFWIPGMGTFSARVLLHGERYAGTWQHDAKGGHMYGKLEKIAE